MIKPTEHEQEFIDEMLEMRRQLYLADSYKRRNDLRKGLCRLEREWFEYVRFRRQAQQSKA